MKKVLNIIFLLLIVIIPYKVKGFCSTEDKMRYTNLATNVVSSYDYIESDNKVTFSVTLHNVHSDLIVTDTSNDKKYRNTKSVLGNITINNLNAGTNYAFRIGANNNKECSYLIFNTVYVSIPKYNKYYSDDVCIGASDYILCQKWAETETLTHDEFVNKVRDYKSVKNQEDKVIEVETTTLEEEILDFWGRYYLFILGGIILICIPIIIIESKRDRFDF